MAATAAANSKRALIRRQARTAAVPLGKLWRIHPDGAPARGPIPLPPARRSAQGSGATDTAMCRVWPGPLSNGRSVGERTRRPPAAHELTWWRAGADYGWPVGTHSREYSVRRISAASIKPPRTGGSTAGRTPRLPPRFWRSTVRSVSRLSWQSVRPVGWSRAMWQGSLQADGTVASEENHSIGGAVRDVRPGPGWLSSTVLTDSPDDGQLLRLRCGDLCPSWQAR